MKKLLPLFILIFAFSALGQNIEATTSDGKKVVLRTNKTWDYVSENENNVKRKTSDIQPDNLKEVIEIAKATSDEFKKSEFETDEQYKNRIGNFVKQKQFKDRFIDDICVEVQPDIGLRYNAEKQEFSAVFFNTILADREYGYFSTKRLNITFSMTPAEAKTAKPLIKILFIGFPVDDGSSLIFKFIPNRMIVKNSQTNEIYLDNELSNFITPQLVKSTSYQRVQINPNSLGFRTVKAVQGDTVKKIAERYGANPVDVANLNGFNSINQVLAAGREVKIPVQ